MKIRVLSDIHLESGPFTYEDLGEDVVVLAGDIGVGTQGVEWAKSIPKPVIYVPGNHEYWKCVDFHEEQAAMRKAARGSNVRFLERDEAVIEVNGESVRFLGCTLWTDYWGGDRNMVYAAFDGMRDYGKINAPGWNARNAKRIEAYGKGGRYQFWKRPDNAGLLHPLMMMDIHRRSVKWLKAKLNDRDCRLPTVVVSHHAPSMQSLLRARMATEDDLKHHDKIRWREDAAIRMAAYASNQEELIQHSSSHVALWCHGHTHEPLDYALNGIRVVCNPRGYHDKPLTLEKSSSLALFGYMPSPQRVTEDQEDYAQNPERGTTIGFERDKLIDIADGLVPCLVPQARKKAKELLPIIEELRAVASNPLIDDACLRPLLVRGLRDATVDANRIREAILNEYQIGCGSGFSMHEVQFPQSLYFNASRVDFDALERVPVPLSVSIPWLIGGLEELWKYFNGDGYKKYVAELWDKYSKTWLRRNNNADLL